MTRDEFDGLVKSAKAAFYQIKDNLEDTSSQLHECHRRWQEEKVNLDRANDKIAVLEAAAEELAKNVDQARRTSRECETKLLLSQNEVAHLKEVVSTDELMRLRLLTANIKNMIEQEGRR